MNNLLENIITPATTLHEVHAESKKRLFEVISEVVSQAINDVDEKQIFECLIQRERLGSTYVGHGIAIPHARLKGSFLATPIGVLLHLDKDLPYGDQEDETVDLVFALIVPEEATQQHLDILSTLANSFRNTEYCNSLREAKSNIDLYQAAIQAP